MKSNFVWLFITYHMLAFASADLLRNRRDLVQIQNFVRWLLGINEGNIIQAVPLFENYERDRIYTIPPYESLLVGAVPQTDIDENFKHTVVTEERYPSEILAPVIHSDRVVDFPIVYNNNPPRVMHSYVEDRYTERRDPLLQPPLHIQNRMPEMIFNRPNPPVNFRQNDIFIPPPNLRHVEVSNFPLQESSQLKDKIVKFDSKNSNINKVQTQPTPVPNSAFIPNVQHVQGQWNTNSELNNNTKKRITFKNPVRSRYTYKMVYHNEPHKNILVKMDNVQPLSGSAPKENEIPTQLKPDISARTNQNSHPSSSADYVYVPPLNTEVPPPGIPKVNVKTMSNENTFLKNSPIVVLDESPYTNAADGDMVTKSRFGSKRTLSSLPEYGRGDIPDLSLK